MRHFDGVPVKYVGDGALGFFSGADMSERALRAAVRMRDLIGELEVALHRGEIYLGTIGHPDYAALDILGATVNTAFMILPHVHSRCAGRIGLTEAAKAELSEDLTPAGVVELSGESVSLFQKE
jgi:class 3 adenylate cyclase